MHMREELRTPNSNFAVSLVPAGGSCQRVPANDSRGESVHLKPFSTHNFESDTVLSATAGCGLCLFSPRFRREARRNRVRRTIGPKRFTHEIFHPTGAYYLMDARRHPERMSPAEQAVAQERIALAKAGNTEAWGELYREHAPAIFRFCRRAMPTREDAEDATMDIFIKVRQKLSQYDASRPFSAWLYTVAANHCWDLLRRRKLRQGLETGEVETMPLEHPDPGQLQQLIARRTGQEVRRALDKLPARSRMALVLRYYSDMSYDDIAATLGVRRTFVGVVLLRARHQLREILEGQGGASLAAGGAA
jgi:RNA polymerase sigma factor (sigma-70 family)